VVVEGEEDEDEVADDVPNGDPVRGCPAAGLGSGVGVAGRAGAGVGVGVAAGVRVAAEAGVNDGLIPSAGIGGAESASLTESVAPSLLASSFAVFPLAPVSGVACARDAPLAPLAPVDPERELPDLARDDDIEPLSTITPSPSTSGSDSRRSGAVMNGDRVFDPASSTPSSSVPNWMPLCTFSNI
jgi:hypothetical protein